MERSKVIIVEGPQGAGKTTLTNMLRELITSTNLIRMSGVKDKTETDKLCFGQKFLRCITSVLRTERRSS